MKHIGLFSLLLLVCCLPGAELQDTERTEHVKHSPETLNVPDQCQLSAVSCLSDIHAVLREMSAALAEQRVRMEQLQKENQGQAAKLREIEKQTNEVETLKQQLQVKQVAFSASLLASGSETIGPFNTHSPLVFRHVVSNIGNAYNSNTGFFTAPVRGAYHFEFYIGAKGHASQASGAMLVKNGEHIFIAYEEQTSGFGTSANGATLLLEAGDIVFLNLWKHKVIYDDVNHHSTFSGHLLFTM